MRNLTIQVLYVMKSLILAGSIC